MGPADWTGRRTGEDLVMRTTLDFAPLWRSTIGFDDLADLVDTTLRHSNEDNYPPYNIERSREDHYRISLAVPALASTISP